MAFSTGYDMKNDFKFNDGLGKLYTGIAAVWTVLITCGSIFLIRHRKLPFLRIRNIPLAVSAVAVLHVYWLLCMSAYGLNGFFPCATEFWIMNIYLPLGIALFHLSNARLLHIAVLQRRYASAESLLDEKDTPSEHNEGWKKHAAKLKYHSTYKKTKWFIILGLLIQFTLALMIFLMSRKFHQSYGLVGEVNAGTPTAKRQCRKGWEWILSILWQFLWSWIYAPYLLWKVRDIRDTHGWRLQTAVCCLAGLPASPMWLLALYLPQLSKISLYFIPPLWFAPSVLLIEAFMIFLPCWHIFRHRSLKKETLEILAKWEQQKDSSSLGSGSTNDPQSPRRICRKPSVLSMRSSRKSHPHMYTMAALEKALQTNSTPLLLFAALKDFSGENISFLNHVREWDKNWQQQRLSVFRIGPSVDDARLQREQFAKAVEIYCSFVSLRYSTFPINISHNHLKELEAIFENTASVIDAEPADCSNSITPFDDFAVQSDDVESKRGRDGFSILSTAIDTDGSATEIEAKATSKQSTIVNVYKLKELNNSIPLSVPIPAGFGPGAFNNAAESIKYMVLTNTWPKFVEAGYAANTNRGTALERLQERLSEYGIGKSRFCSF